TLSLRPLVLSHIDRGVSRQLASKVRIAIEMKHATGQVSLIFRIEEHYAGGFMVEGVDLRSRDDHRNTERHELCNFSTRGLIAKNGAGTFRHDGQISAGHNVSYLRSGQEVVKENSMGHCELFCKLHEGGLYGTFAVDVKLRIGHLCNCTREGMYC